MGKLPSVIYSLCFSCSIYMVDNIFIRIILSRSYGNMRHSVIFIWARICIKQRISIFFSFCEYYFYFIQYPCNFMFWGCIIIYYSINRRRLAQYVVSVCISILLCSWYVFPLIYSTHGESFTMLNRDWFPTMSRTYISLYNLISGEIIKSAP